MEKILYPTHPVICIIPGPSECGKSSFLTNSSLIYINEGKKYTFAHQVFIKTYIKN